MLSRSKYLIRRFTPTAPSPVAWLLPEIIDHILGFIAEERASGADTATPTTFFTDLARLCRGWYHPVSAYIFSSVAPTSFRSCELLIRSLDNNPQLSLMVKSLTIPKIPRLFYRDISTNDAPILMLSLIGKCPNLVELRIPMKSSIEWTADLLQAHLPSMEKLRNLKSLEISALDMVDPLFSPLCARYVSMWLLQVPSLPQLERLTLSDVEFFGSYHWPSLPRLRFLYLHRPSFAFVTEDLVLIPLLSEFRGSLKVLHLTNFMGNSPHASHFETIHTAVPTLEELTIVCPPLVHDMSSGSWFEKGPEHMTSLRYLHINNQLCQPSLLNKLPPLLDTLVITLLNGDSKLNLRSFIGQLPSTVKNLVIKVRGHLMETDHVETIAPVLSRRIKAKVTTFQKEMYQIANERGINLQIETQDGVLL